MIYYLFPPSPNVRKVNAVIAHLQIGDVERRIVNMAKGEHKQPDYLDINPMGVVPALVDGDLLLWESNAICLHLCEQQGPNALLPSDERARSDVYRWMFWESSAWSRATEILTHENVRKVMMGIGEPDPTRVAEGEALFRHLASILEGRLSGQQYLTGDNLTLADFVVGGAATYLERAKMPVADFPNLRAWWARLNQVPAWAGTVPSSQLPS